MGECPNVFPIPLCRATQGLEPGGGNNFLPPAAPCSSEPLSP